VRPIRRGFLGSGFLGSRRFLGHGFLGPAIGVGADELGAGSISSWTLAKTGGVDGAFNAGASSVQKIAGDGWVEITPATNTASRVFGFSTVDANQDYVTIHFGMNPSATGGINAYESGTPVYSSGSYVGGTPLRVKRTGTTMTYEAYVTGAWSVLYTSLAVSTGDLLIDTSIAGMGVEISRIRLFDNGVQVHVTWQNVINCTATAVP
jgi:hypothetical protein